MKKNFLLCSFLVLLSCGCFAQSRIGGDLGFGIYAKTQNGSSNKNINLNFNIEPRYAYMLNEKWEIGGSLTLGTWQTIQNSRTSNFVWAINPFARFRMVGNEKIGFWLETKGTLGTSTVRNYNNSNVSGSGLNLQWGFNVNPVLTYQITDHLRLDATFAFLGVGLNGYTHIDGGITGSTIDFGAHLSNGSFTTVIDHVNSIMDYGWGNSPLAQGMFAAKMVDFQIGFSYSF